MLSHDAQPCHLGLEIRKARYSATTAAVFLTTHALRACFFSLTLSLVRSYSNHYFLACAFPVASRRFIRSSSLCSRDLHTLWKCCTHVPSAHNTSWLLALALDSTRRTYSDLDSGSSQATEGTRHETRRDEIELLEESSNMHPGVRRSSYCIIQGPEESISTVEKERIVRKDSLTPVLCLSAARTCSESSTRVILAITNPRN